MARKLCLLLALFLGPHSLIRAADKPPTPDLVLQGMKWTANGTRHWLRAEVHDSQGELLLFGNPVYIGFTPH